MKIKRRLLDFTFILGEGAFGESGANTLKVSGLRAQAKIVKAGGPSMSRADVAIYGLTLSNMNELSTLGMRVTLQRRNSIIIEAGTEEDGMSTVFQGTIVDGFADMAAAPDVAFRIGAHTGLLDAVKPASPTSIQGSADVAGIMSGLATQMGLVFQNSGVTARLSNPYFYGSPRMQAQACAEAAGINWIIDDNVLAIWPRDGVRGGAIPLISKETGMVGYPAYTSNGIMVRTLFNHNVGFGQKIRVESDLEPASGEWAVFSLAHDLSTLMPGGPWFTTIEATTPETGPVIR